jgi:hypothetical protein
MRISSSALKCQQQSFSWQGCRLHPAGDWLQVTWDDNARKPQSARACAVDPEAEPPRVKRAPVWWRATLIVTYFAWIPDARTSGLTPGLTIAAGAAHALAASFTGDRLLDDSRTRSFADAGLLGALTSLLALAIISPLFAIFLFATDITQPPPGSAISSIPCSSRRSHCWRSAGRLCWCRASSDACSTDTHRADRCARLLKACGELTTD